MPLRVVKLMRRSQFNFDWSASGGQRERERERGRERGRGRDWKSNFTVQWRCFIWQSHSWCWLEERKIAGQWGSPSACGWMAAFLRFSFLIWWQVSIVFLLVQPCVHHSSRRKFGRIRVQPSRCDSVHPIDEISDDRMGLPFHCRKHDWQTVKALCESQSVTEVDYRTIITILKFKCKNVDLFTKFCWRNFRKILKSSKICFRNSRSLQKRALWSSATVERPVNGLTSERSLAIAESACFIQFENSHRKHFRLVNTFRSDRLRQSANGS